MRLDKYIVEKYHISREKAQVIIRNNNVFVNEKICNKSSKEVGKDDKIDVNFPKDYVSRGAYKLLGAIDTFSLKFDEKVVLDLGASTGGFTQVALEYGAKKVYAVDIGANELADTLKKDLRVVNMPNTDVRNLNKDLIKDSQIIIGDLSFISLTKILPIIKQFFSANLEMMFLFKPQFECGKEIAKKYKGVIKNEAIHIVILKNFLEFINHLGYYISDLTFSPITGGDGNIEYLIYINGKYKKNVNIQKVVKEAFMGLKKQK